MARTSLDMRPLLLLFPLLALAACNANQPAPDVQIAQPAMEVARVAPREAPEGGCAGAIARYRSIVDHDAATGNVAAGVNAQIQSEIAEATRACEAGDALRAQYLLRASEQKHGYPQG